MPHDFTRACHPAGSVQVRMLRELGGGALDIIKQIGSGGFIALGDELDDGERLLLALASHWTGSINPPETTVQPSCI
ncbi:hypothetical protein [Duganella phyllosphaerae]|uniref:hypothetical protein n=1 Tax=Duganella phyllosphaerae TaxID=762836 RepID=UPI0027D836A2|nr:hypothetical protein [Duganella phyllosphaerae]